MAAARAIDRGEKVELMLLDPVPVRCPACGARALVRAVPSDEPPRSRTGRRAPSPFAALLGPHRLSCGSCGLVRTTETRRVTLHDDGHDPWFHAPVWFRADTSAGVVWAYTETHLRLLREWIAADQRECRIAGGWRSTLPRRLTAASARPVLLRAIDTMLADAPV